MKKTFLIFALFLTYFCVQAQNVRLIQACKVEKATKPLLEKPFAEIALESIESTDSLWTAKNPAPDQNWVAFASEHSFIGALQFAYAQHRPFTFSPDMLWLLICNGFSNHVRANFQALRSKFVKFEGKKIITVDVRAMGFDYFRTHLDTVPKMLSERLKERSEEKLYNLLNAKFSTSTPETQIAFQASFLDIMSNYYEYEFALCGIPEIRLEGTAEDYKEILKRCQALREYGLGEWINALEPILQKFIEAAEGKNDEDFWQKIYKGMSSDMCGVEPTLTGWITKFFPYIYVYNPPMNEDEDYKIELVKNLTMILPVEEMFAQRRGIEIPQLPPNRVSFPFKIVSAPKKGTYNMQFNAGFIGVTQDSDLTLKPQISWAVIEKNVTVLEQPEDGETITENENQGSETFTEKDSWEKPLGYGSFENDSLLDNILLEIRHRERGEPENFDKYIKKNLKYPKKALEKKISGEVILWINLEKDGTLSKVRIAEGLGYGLDEEAIRLVKNYTFRQGERAVLDLISVSFKLPRKRK